MPAPSFEELQPMLAAQQPVPAFSSPDYAFEIKFDGFRCLAQISPEGIRLKSREGTDMTLWFPEVATALRAAAGKGRAVVDGEICVLNELGIAGDAEFQRLVKRAARRGRGAAAEPVVFCVFDALVFNGRSVMAKPLAARKRHLQQLLAGVPHVLIVGHILHEGVELYRAVLQLKLEGLIAKRLDAPYVPGRTTAWLKVKRPGAVPAQRFRGGGG